MSVTPSARAPKAGPRGNRFLIGGILSGRLRPSAPDRRRGPRVGASEYVVVVSADPLDAFSPAVREWFAASFERPTAAQSRGWPAIARDEHALILAPTGSGKTLAAFLW